MTLEPRKVFVGGIPKTGVTQDDLKEHFARYGDVVEAVIMTYPESGLGRGFGFVEFADEAALVKALDWKERENHVFNNRRVDVMRARTRHGQTQPIIPNTDSKKIFVGGLRNNVTKEELAVFFEKFGTITAIVVMYERVTRRPRGFGFVTFDSQEAVDKILNNRFHDINGTKVETKIAEPKRYKMNGGYGSPNSYSEMCSPYNVPYFFHNGGYMIPTFPYFCAAQGFFNYGYM